MPNDLISLIKQKQDAIAKLQTELSEALKILSQQPWQERLQATPSADRKLPRPLGRRRKGQLRRWTSRTTDTRTVGVPGIIPTSSVGLAQAAIREIGKPLHITDIMRAIEGQGHKVKKITLVGNLSRYVKARRVFYRPSPSVFGLIELRKGA